MNVEGVKQKLLSGDPDILQQELLNLYRRAEVFHGPQFGQILEVFFPIFRSLLLNKLPPQFRSTSTNRARKALLQIINRLPSNDILRPYAGQLLMLLMDVLEQDNEDNSILALKTIFDLHRNFRPGLRNEVPVFLDFVHHTYKNIDRIVYKQLSGTPVRSTSLSAPSATSNSDNAISGLADSKEDHAKSADVTATEVEGIKGENVGVADISVEKKEEDIFKSNESFKVISEIPLIIMLLFQCYPTYIDSYVPTLVPLMMTALSYRAPNNAIKTYPSRYMQFLDCQVKTLSFVTYLLRGFASLMRPFQASICENTVKLLIACPKDAFVIRKDIFVAARHIISTDFRRGFYSQLEILMDDDVLIGRGKTNSFQIRPLAYSTLADMIHHVRDMLSLVQVSKIVDFYGKRIHDLSLPLSIQTTSIRLLLNLVDICAKNEDPDGWKGRNILSRILLIISSKFKTTLDFVPIVLSANIKASCERANDLLDESAMDKINKSNLLPDVVAVPSVYEKQLHKLLDPYVKVQREYDSIGDEEPQTRDVKSLLRTMILGVRAVIWCTANYRNPNARDLTALDISNNVSDGLNEPNLGNNEIAGLHIYPLSDDERILIAKVLQNGLRCFVLYTLSENTVAEEKQMLDHFAGAFTVLDAEDFRDLFIANISLLYDCILQDHAILTIPQHFLANANVSCWFAEILLKFLVSRMDDLSVESEGDIPDIDRVEKVMKMGCIKLEKMREIPKSEKASIILRLFKIVFGSVTLFKSNESALFPHLRTIIESCLKKATSTRFLNNYLLLLRALFRSISGGKYEHFYKEIFPLLPGILSALMRLQRYMCDCAMQEILLELCLTIPARLSSLLQYLPSLMKSVVKAILSRGELAYLGLRTLEFWIDNLNPDFLYPIMTSQDRLLTEIIEALNTHLLPPPYPYGELAMRILGKIGGRNRQYASDALNIEYSVSTGCIKLPLVWEKCDEELKLHIGILAQRVAKLMCELMKKSVHLSAFRCQKSRGIHVKLSDEGFLAPPTSSEVSEERISDSNWYTINSIRHSIQLYKSSATNFVSRITYVVMSRNVTAARLSTTGQKISDCHVEADEKLDEQTLHCLIGTLFQASTDEDVGADALKYLKAIYIFACKNILEACSRSAPSPSVLSEIRQSTLLPASRGLSPGRHLATLKRIDAIKEAMYGKVHIASSGSTCNFSTLQRAIISALCSSDEEVAQNGKLAIKWIIDTHVEHYKSSREAVQHGGALFNQFCELCCHSCYDKSSWRNKLGGIYGLLTLVDLLDPCWTHENLLIIMKALFFVLTDHPIEITAMISSYTGKTMLKALEKSWEAKQSNSSGCDSNSEKIKIDFQKCAAFQETELFQMFVVELFSPKTSSRRYAKKCISKFASLSNSTPSSLLFPYHQLIGKQIMGTNLRLLPVGTRTGYIDAMAYSLSLNPPIFSLNKDVLMFLQDVWGIISDDNTTTLSSPALSTHPLSGIPSKVGDTGNNGDMGSNVASASSPVSAQEYPFGMSQVCEMRIAAVKLLRAAFLAGPDEINQHHEARNRFVGVFFRYLTGQTLELVLCAQEALTDVIHLNKHNKDISLPKELLQQCLRPVLLNLADYRKLNIPLLDGLSRLLSLLSSCFNVTLGEKLLEHLKQWRDPERIMKAGIWKRGEEPAVAASIIDLFHLLPPNDSFLEPLINCVVELEAVLPRYGSFGKMSSPYRIPLTKFLNRYASLTVGFFFKKEHLIDKNYSLLFQELIKIPEAGPIRAVLTGDGGSEAIMTATFIAASKLGSYVADLKSGDSTDDSKIQAQIQLNAQKAAAQAVAAAQAQGMSASSAEARGIQARAAYVAKAQAQINAQHAVKTQSQIQIQANAQKIHAQTLVTAQAQGLSLVQAQAKAQHASKEYITKAQSLTSGSIQVPLSSASSSTLVSQQQALHAQIQANAQKVHAQALAAAQAQGLKPIQAQEKAKQAQATYVHRAKAQAQAKLARAQSQNAGSVAHSGQKFHQEALELHYQGLRLVRSISKIHPGWLGSQIGLIDCLKKLWRSSARIQRLLANDRLPIRYHMESKLMIKCFINYSRAKQDDVQILLDMLSVFLHKTSFDFSFLQCYYGEEVAVSFSSSNKRNIIRLFLRMLHEPNASEELKVYAIQMLVVPILTKTFEDPDVDNSEVLDSETIMWMLKEILASKEYPLDSMQILRIELLKLGTLLIQHMSKYVTDHRKEVIKFAWNHLKAPDLTAKLWGYVNVCRFISVYETPPKIVLQVYVALLRTHEMDSRFLVRKAFDVLLPALPNRLPSNEFIKAIKWTKKIVYEEGHVLGQLVHIWFLIVRHPALFYPFRSQFVPLMVNSLNRLAIPPSSTPDNRRLAVNIVDLIVSWEHTRRKRIESRKMYETVDECKRLEECNKGKRMMPSDHDEDKSHSILKKRKVNEDSRINVTIESKELGQEDSLTAIKSDVRYSNCEDDFELNSVMVDLVVNFAFRFALASADKQETSRLSKTCGDLFNKALLLWPSASIRFSYFDKLIAVTAEVLVRQQNNKPNGVASSAASHTASIPPFFTVPKGAPLASLAILNAVLGILNTLICSEVVEKSSRSIPYVIQYTPRIMKLLEPCFDRNNSEIQSSLSIFIKRMVKLFPPSRAPPQLQSSKFYLWLKDIIIDRLNNLLLVQHECILAQQSKQKSRGPSQDQFSKSEVKQVDHGSVSDGSTTQEKGSKSEGNMMTQMDGSHRKLLLGQHQRGTSSSCYILNLLVAISEVAPSFVENFTPLLLKLTQSFMKEHLIYTTRQNRFSPSNTSSQQSNVSGGEQSINDIADIVMATPSIAILTEWTNIQSGHSGLSRNNFTVRTEENQMAGGSKDALGSGVKDSSVKKTREQLLRSTGPKFKGKLNLMGCVGRKSTVEMLIFCLKLISFCPLNVPEHRRMYFNLLMHCIESSRDVALLLEVIGIVDGMISGNMNEAFSLRERLSLVAKMASFERMHEATALSVFRAYHRLLLKLSKTEELELASLSPSSGGFPSQFMMGLMAPESAIREGFLNRFLVDTDAHPTSRLKHVLKQDWQICGSRFWVVILVDVLLASVCDTSYVKQNEFTEEIKAADIFEPLRVLVQIDVHIASDLWVSLFNHVWSISTDASRKGIAQNLSVILSSKFHTRHLQVPFDMWHGRLNVVQSLLKAVTLVQPLPVMTPELILHLAPTYSVWTDAIRLCEFQVQNDQIDAELRVRWIESLSSLYRQLDEDDLFVGLHVNHSSRFESRVALLLEALGCVHEAQEEYLKGLTRTNSSLNDFEAMSVSELRVWEERWVECAKQLCQWQLMNDFAKATQSPELLLECAWKRGDWSSAKQLLLSPSTQTSLETWCPESRLQRLYIAILDGEKKSTVENLSAQTVELALTQWQGLPRVLSRAHVRLMHLFHKFIEVKESIQMMSDIKCASQQHSLPNLKPSINTWRERLPNKWEPILLWDDILTWRSHMFQVVKSTFAWSDPQVLACMHDTPWSIIKLAHTARKQHLPDVCLGALSKLYSVPAMDVQDAFSKLREQVSICYESSTEYSGGLSILNNTNLDYFSLRQKSEMFRLKALFLQSMGRLSDANQTFSQCLQICDSYGKGWLSWGNYCYELFLSRREMSIASQAIACYLQAIQHRCNSGRMMIARVLWLLSMDDDQGTLIQSFEAHGKQLPIWIWIIWIPQLLMALNRPEAPQIRGLLRGLAAKFPQALYYTMRAFFLDNKESAIGSRNKQSSPPTLSGLVSSTLGNGHVYPGPSIPSTPNNDSSAEISAVQTEYLYFRTKTGDVVAIPATSSDVQIQEISGLIGPARTSPNQFGIPIDAVLSLETWKEKVGIEQSITRQNTALYFTEDLLNFLRRSHDQLAFEMECMLEEIIVRFRPEPEEELLTAVHALLLKCYQLPLLNKSELAPRMLQGTLAKVCKKFFVLMPFQKHEKHLRFVNEFKEKFELDFAVRSNLNIEIDQESSTPTLYDIIRRLQYWKKLLQTRVQNAGERNGNKLYLEHSSRHLIELSSTAMEVPGQYISDAEPIKDLHARIAYFENTSDVILRNGYTQRRITVGGSNGKRYSFLVQYAMTHITRTDERVMQMHLLLNRLLLRHKESRRRNAVYHVQKVVPLTPRVRLLEDSTDFVTLGEIYELHFERAMKDPDLPIEQFREKMYTHYNHAFESSTNEEEMKKVKIEIFDEICSSMVPESLLSKYVYALSRHSDDFFHFRNEFTIHLALTSFLTYILHVGDRIPHRILFSRKSGRALSAELRPSYTNCGLIDVSSEMPFRMTRNLLNFITRAGLNGPFHIILVAASEALMGEGDILNNQLSLFFRDDLLSWHDVKHKSRPDSDVRLSDENILQLVEKNVQMVIQRVKKLSLKKLSDHSCASPITELLNIATSPEQQSAMPPTWYPWL